MYKAALRNWPTAELQKFVGLTAPLQLEWIDAAMADHAWLDHDHPLKFEEMVLCDLLQIANAILESRLHFTRDYERDLVALGCELAHVPLNAREPVWLSPSATAQRIARRCGVILTRAYPDQTAQQLAERLDRDLVTMWGIGTEPEFAGHIAADLPEEPLGLGQWTRQVWVDCWGGTEEFFQH